MDFSCDFRIVVRMGILYVAGSDQEQKLKLQGL